MQDFAIWLKDYRVVANYSKLSHPSGDDYENWLAAEQAVYYREVICCLVSE